MTIKSKKAGFAITALLVIIIAIVVFGAFYVFTTQIGGKGLGLADRVIAGLTGEQLPTFEIDNTFYITTSGSGYHIAAENFDDSGRPELVFLKGGGGARLYSIDEEKWYTIGSYFETLGSWVDVVTGSSKTQQVFDFAAVTNRAALQHQTETSPRGEYYAQIFDLDNPSVVHRIIETPGGWLDPGFIQAIVFDDFFPKQNESDTPYIEDCDPPGSNCFDEYFCNADNICELKKDTGETCGDPHPLVQKDDTCISDACISNTCKQFYNDCTEYCASLEEFQNVNLDTGCVSEASACELFRTEETVHMSVHDVREGDIQVSKCFGYCCCINLGSAESQESILPPLELLPVPELVLVSYENVLKFFPQGTLAEISTGECQISTPRFWKPIIATSLDYNKDGLADLAVLEGYGDGTTPRRMYLFENSNINHNCRGSNPLGHQQQVGQQQAPVPTIRADVISDPELFDGAVSISSGDFNDDGISELVVLFGDRIEIRYMPTFTLAQTVPFKEWNDWEDITVADVTGDKSLEVVIVGGVGKIRGYTISL